MKLAERHEQIVTGYLREVARFAGDGVAAGARERGLAQLEARIRTGIARLRKAQPEDADIEGVLKEIGSPAVQAALLDAPEPADESARKRGDRIWLGVCRFIAEKTEFPPVLVRVAFSLLGLCTGPLALIAYTGIYGFMRFGTPKAEREPIDWLTLVWRVGSTFIMLYLLRTGFGYLIRGLELGYAQGVERGLPELGDWGRLRYSAGTYYSYAFLVCLPLAGFSALPLERGWGKSIYRFSQALVALYAITLCYGSASFIVGLILEFVKQFSGNFEQMFQGVL